MTRDGAGALAPSTVTGPVTGMDPATIGDATMATREERLLSLTNRLSDVRTELSSIADEIEAVASLKESEAVEDALIEVNGADSSLEQIQIRLNDARLGGE